MIEKVINSWSGTEAKFKVSLRDTTWLGSKEVLKTKQVMSKGHESQLKGVPFKDNGASEEERLTGAELTCGHTC